VENSRIGSLGGRNPRVSGDGEDQFYKKQEDMPNTPASGRAKVLRSKKEPSLGAERGRKGAPEVLGGLYPGLSRGGGGASATASLLKDLWAAQKEKRGPDKIRQVRGAQGCDDEKLLSRKSVCEGACL